MMHVLLAGLYMDKRKSPKLEVTSYFRYSTDQWVYNVDGTTETTSFTFRYPHKFKLVAWVCYKCSIKWDIKNLAPDSNN